MPDQTMQSSNNSTVRVVIFNSSALVCTGLEYIVKGMEELRLVGTATNTSSALALCEAQQPDLVVTDINLPQLDGILITQRSKEKRPGVKVLVLSESADVDQIFSSLSNGADGYCLNDVSSTKVQNAIATILNGGLWFDASLSTTIRKAAKQLTENGLPETNQDFAGLSEREIEVLRLIAMGYSNVKIGSELNISSETVKTHIRHIMKKLAVADRTQAAIEALRRRILQ